MRHKTPPLANRISITGDWRSRWLADKKSMGRFIVEDYKIRKYLLSKLGATSISKIEIERSGVNLEKIKAIVSSSEPGKIIGKGGKKALELQEELGKLTGKAIDIEVIEVQNTYLDAALIAGLIAKELENKRPHRRVMHKYAELALHAGAKGVKIQIKGRIAGIEIARREWFSAGRMPLSTLRAQIDYGTATTLLKKGTIGVKVWIYKGDKFD